MEIEIICFREEAEGRIFFFGALQNSYYFLGHGPVASYKYVFYLILKRVIDRLLAFITKYSKTFWMRQANKSNQVKSIKKEVQWSEGADTRRDTLQ